MDEFKQRLDDIEYKIDFDIQGRFDNESIHSGDLENQIDQLRDEFHDFEEKLNRKIKRMVDKKINERLPQNNDIIMAVPVNHTRGSLNDGGIRGRQRFSRTDTADIPPSTPARRINPQRYNN